MNGVDTASGNTPEKDRKKLGERIRDARDYLGYSQEDVARYIGIPRSALSNIESGHRRLETLELRKLARLLEKPLNYFTDDELTPLPDDVTHLARQAAQLSPQDRAELAKFVTYLKARSLMTGD